MTIIVNPGYGVNGQCVSRKKGKNKGNNNISKNKGTKNVPSSSPLSYNNGHHKNKQPPPQKQKRQSPSKKMNSSKEDNVGLRKCVLIHLLIFLSFYVCNFHIFVINILRNVLHKIKMTAIIILSGASIIVRMDKKKENLGQSESLSKNKKKKKKHLTTKTKLLIWLTRILQCCSTCSIVTAYVGVAITLSLHFCCNFKVIVFISQIVRSFLWLLLGFMTLTAIFQKSLPRFPIILLLKVTVECSVNFPVAFWRAIIGRVKLVILFVRSVYQSIRRFWLPSWTGKAMASSPSSSSSSLSPPPSSAVWRPPSRARVAGGSGAAPSAPPPPPLMEGVKGYSFPRKSNLSYPAKMSNGTVKHAKNKIMDCHMDWIGDMMPGYQSVEEKERLIGAVIDILCKYQEELKVRISSPGRVLNVHLMLACFHAHLLKFNEALDWINVAVDSLKDLTEESRQHLRAYSYLLQVNFYKISKKMKLMEGITMKVVEEGSAEDLKRIEQLYNDDNDFQAVIYASKGLLSAIMAHQESQIELYRLAVDSEPTCPQWHRMLYQSLRKKRRENNGKYPSFEEKTAITTAFKLNEKCCLSQPLYAGMLEEELKGCRDKNLLISATKEEVGNEIISLMMNALKTNPEDRWTHVRLAEIFAYGNFPHLDPKEGKLMFEELEKRWPEDSMVLHKFGRYFFVTEANLTKALEYFTRGLEHDSGNFPCLMDYLKTSQSLGQDPKVMLEMLEKCLGFGCLYNSGPFVKMMIAKGIFLWMQDNDNQGVGANKHKACQAWVEAASKDLPSCAFIASKIACGYWSIIGNYCIDIGEVVGILNASLSVSKDKANAIRRLISEFQNLEFNNRSGIRQQRFRTLSSSSSTSNCSFVTVKSSFSQADSVNNWRQSPSHLPPLVGEGVFAPYTDPTEQRFNERLARLDLGGLGAVPPQQNTGSRPAGYAKNSKRTSQYGQAPSQADLDDHWRR